MTPFMGAAGKALDGIFLAMSGNLIWGSLQHWHRVGLHLLPGLSETEQCCFVCGDPAGIADEALTCLDAVLKTVDHLDILMIMLCHHNLARHAVLPLAVMAPRHYIGYTLLP